VPASAVVPSASPSPWLTFFPPVRRLQCARALADVFIGLCFRPVSAAYLTGTFVCPFSRSRWGSHLLLRLESFNRAAGTMVEFTGIAADYKLLSMKAAWNDWTPSTQEYTDQLSNVHTRSAQVRGCAVRRRATPAAVPYQRFFFFELRPHPL
jgi:hypothetical protein